MKVNGVVIKGKSVSGYATAVALPDYGLCFDVGMAFHDAIQSEVVAITHGHLDHFGGVARHGYIRGMTGMSTPKYIVPHWLSDATHEQFEFWSRVQGAREAPHEVQGVQMGQDIHLKHNRHLRAFRTFHRVESCGYTLYERRNKLKAEFAGLDGKEIGKLRQEGVEVTGPVDIPIFTFTGDTTEEVFDYHQFQGKVLMVECTFLKDDVSIEKTLRRGHMHISQFAALEEKLAEVENVVLCHFSKRYRNADIEAAIANLPKGLREKTTFLPVDR
jgi:ribonuclease Z